MMENKKVAVKKLDVIPLSMKNNNISGTKFGAAASVHPCNEFPFTKISSYIAGRPTASEENIDVYSYSPIDANHNNIRIKLSIVPIINQ